MNDYQNDLFPELNRRRLSQFAFDWAERFPGIKEISLSHVTDPSLSPIKYQLSVLPQDVPAYEDLKSDLLSIDNMTNCFRNLFGHTTFIDVYRKEPEFQFRNQWTVEVDPPGQGVNPEGGWLLFPGDERLQRPEEQESLHEEIDRLRVWAETDREIGFQIPGMKKFFFSSDSFRFKSDNSEQWLAFLGALRADGIYDTETIRPHKSKAANRQLLVDQINRGILIALRSVFPKTAIPDDYKVWERVTFGDKKGVLRFKFNVLAPTKNRDDYLPKNEKEFKQRLTQCLEQLKKARKNNEDQTVKDYEAWIIKLGRHGESRGFRTREVLVDIMDEAK